MLVNNINRVPVMASSKRLAEHNIPIAAEHHKVAAVVKPLTAFPSFIITPAPKKPIPATT